MPRMLKNRTELIDVLRRRAEGDDVFALALAYLIHEFVPSNRTTKHVFSKHI